MPHLLVYGTLRPGGTNHPLLGSTVSEDTVAVTGLALHAGPGFPYATPSLGGRIVATLCTISRPTGLPRCVASTSSRATTLPVRSSSHYLRRRWPVTTPAGATVQAWIYLAGRRVNLAGYPRIPDGNWLTPSSTADPAANRPTPPANTDTHCRR